MNRKTAMRKNSLLGYLALRGDQGVTASAASRYLSADISVIRHDLEQLVSEGKVSRSGSKRQWRYELVDSEYDREIRTQMRTTWKPLSKAYLDMWFERLAESQNRRLA